MTHNSILLKIRYILVGVIPDHNFSFVPLFSSLPFSNAQLTSSLCFHWTASRWDNSLMASLTGKKKKKPQLTSIRENWKARQSCVVKLNFMQQLSQKKKKTGAE